MESVRLSTRESGDQRLVIWIAALAFPLIGLVVLLAAPATDGTIEGIEGEGFVVGVQWHAETLMAHMPLFEALVTAASRTELRAAA